MNLSFRLAEKYIGLLIDKGWLSHELGESGSAEYVITKEGERVLRNLSEVERDLSKIYAHRRAVD